MISVLYIDDEAALLDITRMAALSVEVQRASIWFLDEARTHLTCACIYDGRLIRGATYVINVKSTGAKGSTSKSTTSSTSRF